MSGYEVFLSFFLCLATNPLDAASRNTGQVLPACVRRNDSHRRSGPPRSKRARISDWFEPDSASFYGRTEFFGITGNFQDLSDTL